jgi:hypothetical protein
MLPKIDAPQFNIELPVSKKSVKVRPFTVKEEKILLFAQQEEKDKSIIEAIIQVINNCVLDKTKVELLNTFELEYLFIKLRAISVNQIITLNIKDEELSTEEEPVWDKAEFDLDDMEIKFATKEAESKIELNDTYMIKLRYPSYNTIGKFSKEALSDKPASQIAVELVGSVIESVYSKDGEEVFLLDDHTDEEREEFYSSLSTSNFAKVQEFMASAPYIYGELKYENSKGETVIKELKGLSDFFMLA